VGHPRKAATCRSTNCSAGRRRRLPAYASLLKYAIPTWWRASREALGRGYKDLKVHETGRAEITVAGQAAAAERPQRLMVDVNAPWVLQEAWVEAAALRELELKNGSRSRWWPPEDFRRRRGVRASGVPVAIGEERAHATDRFLPRLIRPSAPWTTSSRALQKIGGIS